MLTLIGNTTHTNVFTIYTIMLDKRDQEVFNYC